MRIGVDLGGTKIEVVALDDHSNKELLRERMPSPQGSYDHTIRALRDLVSGAEQTLGGYGSVGVGIPGAVSPHTGLVKNANSTWLIGKPLDRDLSAALAREVRVANDANCFVLSEASDGAAAGCNVVYGIIAGTGVGGGLCVGGRVIAGANAITGEWGHNPLPWPGPEEVPGPQCWCGKRGCIEQWCSGPAVARLFREETGRDMRAPEIVTAAAQGDAEARAALDRHLDRFARAIAHLINLLDPDAIVMGGGLSNLPSFYDELPRRTEKYVFYAEGPAPIRKNVHGDSSGVRGAAWLWHKDEVANGLPR